MPLRSGSKWKGRGSCWHGPHGRDHACPGEPYSEKTLTFGGADDTRDCNACTCTPPLCTGQLQVYSDASCTQFAFSKLVTSNNCNPNPLDADGTISALFQVDPAASMCTPNAVNPTGDVVGTGPTTICCQP